MGATTVSRFVEKSEYNPTRQIAFERLVKQDRYENGHSYSGTIGMKTSCTDRKTVDSHEAAQEFIDADMDNNDKFGPAFAVTVRVNGVVVGWAFYGWVAE
jgi:hypothetical protein